MAKQKIIPTGKIDTEGLKSVGKGTLIAGAGAALTYFTANIGNVDFGEWTPVVVAGFGILTNFLRKLLTKYKTK